MPERSKFIQITECDGILHALDTEGMIWYYMEGVSEAHSCWRPVSLTRLSKKPPYTK